MENKATYLMISRSFLRTLSTEKIDSTSFLMLTIFI